MIDQMKVRRLIKFTILLLGVVGSAKSVFADKGRSASLDDTCACQGVLYASGPVNIPVPDNEFEGSLCDMAPWAISDVITLPSASGVVRRIGVFVNISHPHVGDLVIHLVHGSQTAKLKTRDIQAENCHNVVLTFDDDGSPWAPPQFTHEDCNRSGCIHPYNPSRSCGPDTLLSVFRNAPASGDWTLWVSDNLPGDNGYLNSWAICANTGIALASDMGDLPTCSYPTLTDNPGHALTDVAWLGTCVSGDTVPRNSVPNSDNCDDGIWYEHLPWTSCMDQHVTVYVHAGSAYNAYANAGGRLYLNGWKDGNLDGDFCDTLCNGSGPEWFVQDVLVVPGNRRLLVHDPGIVNRGQYGGVFRWRLCSHPVGAYGFGLANSQCPSPCGGTFGLDTLGEVEDYIVADVQLAVSLESFTATPTTDNIRLRWVTASENGNERFILTRNDQLLANPPSQGNSSTRQTYAFVDYDVRAGQTYTYVLAAVNSNHEREELGTQTATAGSFAVAAVTDYRLEQNYPNPFNPTTNIAFDLPEAGFVSLKVHNPIGQEIATLVSGHLNGGHHVVTFDGSSLSSGLYLCKMDVNGFTATRKMLLLK